MLKKSMVFLFVLMITVFSVTIVFAAERGFLSNKQATAVAADNQKCPVMGYAVNRDINVTLDGKTYYFCCNSCVKKFKDDPSKFVKPTNVKIKTAVGEKCFKTECECSNCVCGAKCACGTNCGSAINRAQSRTDCFCAAVQGCNKAVKNQASCNCGNVCSCAAVQKPACGKKMKSGCSGSEKSVCASGSCSNGAIKNAPAKMKCGGGGCSK